MRSFRIVAACLVAVVLATAGTGCSRTTKSPSGSTLPPAERAAAASGESSATTDSSAVKAQTPVTGSSGSNSGSSGTAAGQTGSAGAAGSKSGSSGTVTKPVQPGMPVMVIFWNDTSSKKLSQAEVVIGASSFKPASTAKTARRILGPFAYGKKVDVIVYPDGRDGKKIVVPMVLDRQMIPKSEQDAIHVAISDKTVRVLGNAILNIDQSYPRY